MTPFQTEKSAAADEPLLILVVDDNEDNIRIIGRHLRNAGYRIAEARDGIEALENVDELSPDLVLLDYMMPGLNGYDVLVRLRETHSRSALPVVMLTARTDVESVVASLDAGANDYLAKPFEKRLVLARLSTQIERLRADRRDQATMANLEAIVSERTAAIQRANEQLRDEIAQREMTEQAMRATQCELEAANAAKSMFLANMSHELRTPLNAIIGFSDVMRKETFGKIEPAAYREYIDDINRSGIHLLGLVEDILDMVRIEQGKFQIQPEHFSLNELIEEAIRMIDCAASSRKHPITWESRCTASVFADKRLLRQVICNLLGNAVKFSSNDGSIVIRLDRSSHDEVIVDVIDEGCGIPEDKMDAVLKPFQQVESTAAREHGGIGLGLSIVTEIMSRHEGSLSLENNAGSGITARLILPAARVKFSSDDTPLASSAA